MEYDLPVGQVLKNFWLPAQTFWLHGAVVKPHMYIMNELCRHDSAIIDASVALFFY